MKQKKADPFYSSRPWRRLRTQKLSDTPLCEPCARRMIITPATLVDHKVERKDGGESLDYDNLESMCRACHERKTWRRKRERSSGIVLPPDYPKESPWSCN